VWEKIENMEALYGIAVPIFAVNTSGLVIAWNRKMELVAGISDTQVCQHSINEFLIDPTSWEDALSRASQSTMKANDSNSNVYCTICLQNIHSCDGPRDFRVRVVTNYSYTDNLVLGVVCFVESEIGQEITWTRNDDALIKKQEYIDAREEAKAETEQKLTAYFAHELRNPLSALDSALNAFPVANSNEVKSIVSEMQACIAVMSTIMNNLVDIRKFEEGKVTLASAPMSLRALLSEIHKVLLPSVKPGVLFKVVCHITERDWVFGDSRRLRQILFNVTANAIKYTLAGTVTLTVEWDGDTVVFKCIDTGPGRPGTKGRENQSVSKYQCGSPCTGLDLMVAKRLVDLAGGTMSFQRTSNPSYRDSSCSIYIPLVAVCESQLNSVSIRSSKVIDSPLHFLVVDDVKVNRVMMKRRLQKICLGSLVSEASTGEEALHMCGNEKFDVIIVDQYMDEAGGVMVGTDVIYTLRRIGVDSIIIGCSGNDLDEEFIDAGVDIVWPKPIPTNEEIIRQIRDALESKEYTFGNS
jgi:CheY-like chemotaxis protein/nitrogen-specific signal transduction histidine kinase